MPKAFQKCFLLYIRIYIYIYLFILDIIYLLSFASSPFKNFAPSPKRRETTSLNYISTTHGEKQRISTEDVRNKYCILDNNYHTTDSMFQDLQVLCLIFSANSSWPGKSSVCHALCDPFGTAACPVCHMALKIGAKARVIQQTFLGCFFKYNLLLVVVWTR